MTTSDDFGELIAASWARCHSFGLAHDSRPAAVDLDRPARQQLHEENGILLDTTESEVLPYYDNILANSRSLIMLSDGQGRLLRHWGDRRFVETGRPDLFREGCSWQERHNGTNAIGTAIACGQAIQVQRNEHFLTANRFMVGCAAPIRDVNRRLIGVLNVSSDAYLPQAHTLGMVKLMAISVENRLMARAHSRDCYLLTLNTNPDNLDSQWSGLLALDGDGAIVAVNQRAGQLLATEQLQQPICELLDLGLDDLLAQADRDSFQLRTRTQRRLFGLLRAPSARLNGHAPPRPSTPQRLAADGPLTFADIEFGDEQVRRCIRQATRVSDRDIPILIHGETGVGKEVFVKALHQASERRDQPLVAVNCAAIPSELVESELFGYERGAFTGASTEGATGLIRKAHKGILFLDEIGEMPARAQARLLRVLQEREVTPVGSTEAYPVDIRLISATNQTLREQVEAGTFRRDLYYRINGLAIELPRLRDRSDKRALFRQVHAYYREPDQPAELSSALLDMLERHPWPGNIRQLINVMQVALAMADRESIETWHLPDDFIRDLNAVTSHPAAPTANVAAHPLPDQPAGSALDSLLEVYNQHQGNVSRTARHFGFSRNTVYKRLRELGVR
ncbi:sigma-54-dependent Fis family transcriptional regulator [Marinobacter halodurans]|uniref:Sigma-54-dependent Fis family transcriptional regulator n=2 Tax=Marinobacter halodurans TaxID=2528979 RepID=A0ABY1ZIB5_9GAMM|nr:sigma-54-dependent Fis family transcriptional regulator [Marinobacter halodurans]